MTRLNITYEVQPVDFAGRTLRVIGSLNYAVQVARREFGGRGLVQILDSNYNVVKLWSPRKPR